MELLGIGALLFLIAWQLFRLRSEIRLLRPVTTVYYSIRSIERDANGIEEECINLKKKVILPAVIAPGMEFAGIANNKPTVIERVIVDSEGRGLHLKVGIVPRAELEETKKWYQSRGWQSE